MWWIKLNHKPNLKNYKYIKKWVKKYKKSLINNKKIKPNKELKINKIKKK